MNEKTGGLFKYGLIAAQADQRNIRSYFGPMISFPVLNTFVHFVPRRVESQRCSSAPPEFFVGSVIAQAIKREIAMKNRAKRRTSKVVKKWSSVVEGLWKVREREFVHEICEEKAFRASHVTPKLREVLQRDAYLSFLHYVFQDVRDCAALESMGVIRDHGGEAVEFWCADEPLQHPTMMALLNEARQCRESHEKSLLRLTRVDDPPLTTPFTRSLTLESLRKIVQRRFQIQPVYQQLTHRGRVLSRGVLSDQGVGPGCVIFVIERRHTVS